MKLKQFAQLYPQKMFVRFFYDIEYQYFVTRHFAVYIKYDPNNKNKSIQIFNCLIACWSSLQLDNRHVVKGYDKTFTAQQLLTQLNDQNIIVSNHLKDYYINVLI